MLERGADLLGVSITKEQAAQYESLYALFSKWNKTINLSANDSVELFVERNILDSLKLGQLLKNENVILDFGAGGGFPSLIIKILYKNLPLYAVESDLRKCAFLQSAVNHLKLEQFSIVSKYITKKTIPELDFSNLTIVSRATMSLDELGLLFEDQIKMGQKIYAMVSERVSRKNLKILDSYQYEEICSYELPFSYHKRKIISLVKL